MQALHFIASVVKYKLSQNFYSQFFLPSEIHLRHDRKQNGFELVSYFSSHQNQAKYFSHISTPVKGLSDVTADIFSRERIKYYDFL